MSSMNRAFEVKALVNLLTEHYLKVICDRTNLNWQQEILDNYPLDTLMALD